MSIAKQRFIIARLESGQEELWLCVQDLNCLSDLWVNVLVKSIQEFNLSKLSIPKLKFVSWNTVESSPRPETLTVFKFKKWINDNILPLINNRKPIRI